MINVLGGIQAKFNGSGALLSRFPNGVYTSLAPTDAALPVAVLTVVSATPSYDTGTTYENVYQVQFSVFAESDTVALAAAAEIKTAFDFVDLTLSDGTCLLVKRTNEGLTRDDEQTWQAIVEYEVCVDESY